MPTGYTADLYDGKDVTFEDFVMRCSRAFGALILMRDDPLDAEIPEGFEPSDYDTRELRKAQRQLAEATGWTDEEADHAAEHDWLMALHAWEESEATRKDRRARYEAMLAQVRAWTPPTEEHQGLKDFMVQQLEESIRFDCDWDYSRPERQTAEAFRQSRIEKSEKDIAYHRKHQAEEEERSRGRTQWLRDLRKSLGLGVSA